MHGGKSVLKNSGKLLIYAAVLVLCMGMLTGCGTRMQKKFTMYIGLNDADSGTQKVTMDEVRETARRIITDNGCGYTEYEAYGGYLDGDKAVGNDTIVYVILGTDRKNVTKIALTIKSDLNLSAVVLEEGLAAYTFVE
jgi:hypothetical protein